MAKERERVATVLAEMDASESAMCAHDFKEWLHARLANPASAEKGDL